jgi:hypothetical protein
MDSILLSLETHQMGSTIMFDKDAAEAALAGTGSKHAVSARRGGNLQISFSDLASFKHVLDENGGELMSRCQHLMVAQLEALKALQDAGAPARISNIRRRTVKELIAEGVEEVYTYSPSIWVNNVSNVGASSTAVRQAEAKVEEMQAQFQALLSVLTPSQVKKLKAAQAAAEVEVDGDIPL